jgi:DNA polymerase-3 subunit delta'
MAERLVFAGNPRALSAVQRSLASAHPPRSYLFAGPGGVGKHTLALWLAQALNCESPGGSGSQPDAGVAPCGDCRACTRIAAGNHADVSTVSFDTDDDGRVLKDISVDQVREIERSVALAPYEGRTRVVIIDPADAMNDAAQNAFLKTLEEPPPHAAFILITTDGDSMLPTIRSRCRIVEFRLVPAADIELALTSAGTDPPQAALLARLAGGRIGWALEAARDPALLEQRTERLDQARAVAQMTVAQRMRLAESLSERFRQDRTQVLQTLDGWVSWWRDVMLTQAGAPGGVANVDSVDALEEDAARYDRDEVARFVQALMAAREHLQANVQSKVALEALLLEAPLRRAAANAP